MDYFVWSDQYLTGDARVDAEHQELVRLINALIEARAHAADMPKVEDLLQVLTRYAMEHFSHEEVLMREAGVDSRHVIQHCGIHRNFERQVMRLREAGCADADLDFLLRFITSWLAYHILGMDQSMNRQIRRILAGNSPAAAWQAEASVDMGPAVASLVEALNALYAVMSERNELLSEVNAQLEDMVAERTRQLQAAQARVSEELAQLQRQCQTVVGVGRAISLPVGASQSNVQSLEHLLEQLFAMLDGKKPQDPETRRLLEEDVRQLLREMRQGLAEVAEIVQDADEILAAGRAAKLK